MFIDKVKISLLAGHGGSGCVSFRREKHVPKGGPNGGDGGNGGDIFLIGETNVYTLLDFQYRPRYKSERAEHGKGSNKHGKNGKPLYIQVPLGTVVRDVDTEEFLGDIVDQGQQLLVAKGGRGGRGNARFKNSTNQAPREWEPGEYGEEKTLALELKLIADVGLVGFPNAGKSTLISRISAARPKIADYPFTTLQPNLGIVKYKDRGAFVVADIPGIIEGAHHGKGLGHEFLRHIERTKVLLVLIDCSVENIEEQYAVLRNELEKYNAELIDRISFILLTKADLNLELDIKKVQAACDKPVRDISSVTGQGIEELKDLIWQKLHPPQD